MLLTAALALSLATAPRIEIYTMGQGERIFERYGHAAICTVYERGAGNTVCYNFGTVDFSKPLALSVAFLQGKAKYSVSLWPRNGMIHAYARSDRTIYRQDISLPPEKAIAIARELQDIYADEERRYYIYHHFFDNCATRIRDVLDRQLDGKLSKAADASELTPKTYRQLGREGLADDSGLHTFLLALSDFTIGRALDRPPTRYERMFLPDYLREELATKLSAPPVTLNQRQGPPFRSDGSTGRHWVVLLALLFAVPQALARRSGRLLRLAAVPGAVFLSLLAFLVYGVALISTVPELKFSEAFFVFWPTDVAVPFLGAVWLERYARLRLAGLGFVALLLLTTLFKQPLWVPMFVPVLYFASLLVTRPRAAERAASDQGVTKNVPPEASAVHEK